jgi:hypothetical protein
MAEFPALLEGISQSKRSLLSGLVRELSALPGMAAVVLGGSYAAGTQHASSDLDLGLYYRESAPFSIAEIKKIAERISTSGIPVVTDYYGWGPWVNGGAWIYTAGGKVDFLYRSLEQVERTIDEAARGITWLDYSQQPTHGFHSVIYLAETQICIPLFDPGAVIAYLKERVSRYPERLKHSIVQNNLWGAEFTLAHARKYAAAGDIYNTTGCLARVSAYLTQVLFALNERYFLSDKRVMAEIAHFPLLPPGYVENLTGLLAHPGETSAQLMNSYEQQRSLWGQVAALAGDLYEPMFQLPA